jgi:hypothetical protein
MKLDENLLISIPVTPEWCWLLTVDCELNNWKLRPDRWRLVEIISELPSNLSFRCSRKRYHGRFNVLELYLARKSARNLSTGVTSDRTNLTNSDWWPKLIAVFKSYHFRLHRNDVDGWRLTVDAVNSQPSTVNSELEFTIQMLTDLISRSIIAPQCWQLKTGYFQGLHTDTRRSLRSPKPHHRNPSYRSTRWQTKQNVVLIFDRAFGRSYTWTN